MPSIQKFLAIETSTSPGSVAAGTLPSHRDIANQSRQIDDLFMQESRLPETGSQGRYLMPVLAATVESAGWSLDMTDLVIVATGPGPFTGLRVGITTAKAIVWTNNCSLVGVSTVSCLATQAISECGPVDRVDVIFDAGRGELYAATATQPLNGLIWRVSEGTLKSPEELEEGIAARHHRHRSWLSTTARRAPRIAIQPGVTKHSTSFSMASKLPHTRLYWSCRSGTRTHNGAG